MNIDDFEIGKPVAETDKYRIYMCKHKETGRQCLLQIASAVEHNGGLDRAAYILGELDRRSDELEVEYVSVKKDPNIILNYGLGFPELVGSFICHQQGGRRVNVLAFRNVEDVSRMVPLSFITKKHHQRVDLRTSAWIMGKLLKLLVFAHSEGMSIGLINESNVLIEPDQHYVLLFDWSVTQTFETIPMKVRRKEISHAAQAVIAVLGGDLETGVFPNDGDEGFDKYTEYLLRLARGGESKAERAHAKFYELINALWKREFYPFTSVSD